MCPKCHSCEFKVKPVKYDKTELRIVRTVICKHCNEEYFQEIRTWQGDKVVD